MRRCRGLVLGIVGVNAAARCLATRSLAFRMSVLYFDPLYEGVGKTKRPSIVFPSSARRMDTLNDLLAASDLVSLHCALTNDTTNIISAERLQHIKPGAFIVNTSSCQLIDDCALKQLLLDGTIAGCALDGAEGPQWMEAWVHEMPNVLILPRSADYSEEVWMEIREKAITILQSFFFDGIVPNNAISDEDEAISDVGCEDDQLYKQANEHSLRVCDGEQQTDESQLTLECDKRRAISKPEVPEASGQSQSIGLRSEGRRSRSGKKGKKRPARRRSQQKMDELSTVESGSNYSSRRDDDTVMSGRDQVLSSSSRFASPEESKNKLRSSAESPMEIISEHKLPAGLGRKPPERLKDGFVIALRTRDNSGFHVSRERVAGGGWYLDVVSNATKRDPAAQFLITFKNKVVVGFPLSLSLSLFFLCCSLTCQDLHLSGYNGIAIFCCWGQTIADAMTSMVTPFFMLYTLSYFLFHVENYQLDSTVNKKAELVFASHAFDVWESWTLEGSLLECCKLVNHRNPLAALEVYIEILAAVSEEDGITRWLD
ncbi:C-terminal binding protein AN [Triticum urartu]|uniref:C-terminal binding protein AN n=1 Tax=Triticum urartu TaxID=4572 RepID=M7ZT16_TRIUA|nr:C-terminal binding protein AN [Triticum urartu]